MTDFYIKNSDINWIISWKTCYCRNYNPNTKELKCTRIDCGFAHSEEEKNEGINKRKFIMKRLEQTKMRMYNEIKDYINIDNNQVNSYRSRSPDRRHRSRSPYRRRSRSPDRYYNLSKNNYNNSHRYYEDSNKYPNRFEENLNYFKKNTTNKPYQLFYYDRKGNI